MLRGRGSGSWVVGLARGRGGAGHWPGPNVSRACAGPGATGRAQGCTLGERVRGGVSHVQRERMPSPVFRSQTGRARLPLGPDATSGQASEHAMGARSGLGPFPPSLSSRNPVCPLGRARFVSQMGEHRHPAVGSWLLRKLLPPAFARTAARSLDRTIALLRPIAAAHTSRKPAHCTPPRTPLDRVPHDAKPSAPTSAWRSPSHPLLRACDYPAGGGPSSDVVECVSSKGRNVTVDEGRTMGRPTNVLPITRLAPLTAAFLVQAAPSPTVSDCHRLPGPP